MEVATPRSTTFLHATHVMPGTALNSGPKDLPPVLVIVGPTASGKTALSLHIASRLESEIISADSRQIYREMDIGTAKPTRAERLLAPHHFVDILEPTEDYNAGLFGRQGRDAVGAIAARGRTPMIVGGSGLYLRGLIDGFFEGPGADNEVRSRLYDRLHTEGAEALLGELRARDPEAGAEMLPQNTRRIIRALELLELTGHKVSDLRKNAAERTMRPYFFGLRWARPALYERINRRVDRMIDQGLIDEVERLRSKGYTPAMNALMTTGYVEVFDFFDGKISHAELAELIKRNTRRYAKRQMTWFRPDARIEWIDIESEAALPIIARQVEERFKNASGI